MITRLTWQLFLLGVIWINPVYAVDGVGPLEMFPFLKWIAIIPLCLAASFLTFYVVSNLTVRKGPIMSALMPFLLASIPLFPLVYPIIKRTYIDHVCSAEAETTIIVMLDEWSPVSLEKQELFREPVFMPSGEARFTLTENLSEFAISSKRSLGVTESHRSLVDVKRNKVLLTVKLFIDEDGHTPFSCNKANWFWHWRNKFLEKEKRMEYSGGI